MWACQRDMSIIDCYRSDQLDLIADNSEDRNRVKRGAGTVFCYLFGTSFESLYRKDIPQRMKSGLINLSMTAGPRRESKNDG